ncbi:hypothetical protein ACFX2A_009131 [Malus domestica]
MPWIQVAPISIRSPPNSDVLILPPILSLLIVVVIVIVVLQLSRCGSVGSALQIPEAPARDLRCNYLEAAENGHGGGQRTHFL